MLNLWNINCLTINFDKRYFFVNLYFIPNLNPVPENVP